MIYNLYEIEEIYKNSLKPLSVRTLQRKLGEFKKFRVETDKPLKTYQKSRREALKDKDLIEFIKFAGMSPEIIEKYHCRYGDKVDVTTSTSDVAATEPDAGASKSSDKADKELVKFLKEQLKEKDTQLKDKNEIIKQQNSILMATQKNMNDLLQQHNELKYTTAKKEHLIKQLEYDREKTEESAKALMKLERMIDDALLAKRLKDGIEFTKQLLAEKKKQNKSE